MRTSCPADLAPAAAATTRSADVETGLRTALFHHVRCCLVDPPILSAVFGPTQAQPRTATTRAVKMVRIVPIIAASIGLPTDANGRRRHHQLLPPPF